MKPNGLRGTGPVAIIVIVVVDAVAVVAVENVVGTAVAVTVEYSLPSLLAPHESHHHSCLKPGVFHSKHECPMGWASVGFGVRSRLGPVLVPVRGLLGPLGGLSGASREPFRASWGPLWGLWDSPGVLLGPRARKVRSDPASGPLLGAVLGPSWATLGASWAVFGRSWAVLGPSEGPVRLFRGDPGGSSGYLEASGKRKGRTQKTLKKHRKATNFASRSALEDPLGALWGSLGHLFGRLGTLLGVLERYVAASGPSWTILGAPWGRLGGLLGRLEAPWRPRGGGIKTFVEMVAGWASPAGGGLYLFILYIYTQTTKRESYGDNPIRESYGETMGESHRIP